MDETVIYMVQTHGWSLCNIMLKWLAIIVYARKTKVRKKKAYQWNTVAWPDPAPTEALCALLPE